MLHLQSNYRAVPINHINAIKHTVILEKDLLRQCYYCFIRNDYVMKINSKKYSSRVPSLVLKLKCADAQLDAM